MATLKHGIVSLDWPSSAEFREYFVVEHTTGMKNNKFTRKLKQWKYDPTDKLCTFPRGVTEYVDIKSIKFAKIPPVKLIFNQQLSELQQSTLKQIQFARIGDSCAARINLPPGEGKTRLAAAVIAKYGGPCLYVCPTKPTARQAAAELGLCLGITVDYLTRGQFETAVTSPVVVMVINSAAKLDPVLIESKFRMLILDEVHGYVTTTFRSILANSARYLFGMSGTLCDRADGLDKFTELYIGPIVGIDPDESEPVYDATKPGKVIKVEYKCHREIVTGAAGVDWRHLLDQCRCDHIRNNVALYYVRKLVAQGHNVLVFTDGRYCAEYFAEKCSNGGVYAEGEIERIQCEDEKWRALHREGAPVGDEGVEPAIDTRVVYGGTDIVDEEYGRDHARVIVATYSYLGTGVSFARYTAIVVLEPRRAKWKQIIGRIYRKSGAPGWRKVIDIVDSCFVFESQYRERAIAYQQKSMIESII
jgi:hypothetical protein